MLQKHEYLQTVQRPYTPLLATLVCHGYSNEEYFKGLLIRPFRFKHLAAIENLWYYGINDLKECGELTFESWSDLTAFEYTRKELRRREKVLLTAAQTSVEQYMQAYEEFMPAIMLIYCVEKYVEGALRSSLEERMEVKRAADFMDKLNIPFQDNYYKEEELNLVRTKNIREHVEKYRWLLSRYGEEKEYTVKEAEEKLKEMDKEAYLKKYKNEKEELLSTIGSVKSALGSNGYLVDMFQYIIYYRTQRTDVMNRASFVVIPLLKEKARTREHTYQEIMHHTASEMRNDVVPSLATLKSRIQAFSVILEDRTVRCVSGEESKKLVEFFQESIEDVTNFKGTVVCKGIVRGLVKIVKNANDFSKIEQGDVLVTSMTTPEMVPIMKRARAFVTNEGGVTCHAAIISREMRKPCIIGTKIATQVLKDGDMVEVDADKGVVRIVK